jgi:bacteriocin-like protein
MMTHKAEVREFAAKTMRTLTESELTNVSGGVTEAQMDIYYACAVWTHLAGQYGFSFGGIEGC